jgi:hypothetical protein
MAFGIMGRLSTEDDSVLEGEESTADTNIVIDITLSEAEGEAAALESEIAEDVTAMAQADVAADQVEETIETAEDIAANPETVTPAVVEVTVESLKHTAALLGGSIDSRYGVSRESAKANPMVALEVSIDGAKDFLKKIYESIKAIFRKIINAGKKLFVKLMVVIDGTASKAKKLGKVADKLTGTAEDFDEKQAKSIAYRFGAQFAIEGKKAPQIADIVNAAAAGKDTVQAVVDTLQASTQTPTAVSKETNDKYKDVITKTLKQSKGSITQTASELGAISNYEAPDASGDVECSVVNKKGLSFKVVESYIANNDAKDVVLKVKTLSVSKDYFSGISSMTAPTKTQVQAIIGAVIVDAKNFSKYSSGVMKVIDSVNSALDKSAKEEAGNYVVNKLKAGNITLQRDLVVSLGLDSVMAYMAGTKAALSIANDCVKQFKSAGR